MTQTKATVLIHWLLLCALALVACRDDAKAGRLAVAHAKRLVELATEDVAEVRRGLPEGARHLADLYVRRDGDATDLQVMQEEIRRARAKVQDLRVAKGTFFGVVSRSGRVLRTNLDADRLAGANAFAAFPGLKEALTKDEYTETSGILDEAAGVRDAPDAQWVAGAPVRHDGKPVAVFVTGWSWSAYAYRLENALRGEVRDSLDAKRHDKMPLLYVYVVVDKEAYGAPVSPRVNARAILEREPLARTAPDKPMHTILEITGREFAMGVVRAPVLGGDVAIAVLRSET